MTKLFILLTGYLMLGHPTYSVAQKDVQLQRCCEKIMKIGPCLAFTGDHKGKMRFRLLGIYSHGPTLFFLLRFNNRSALDYDIDSIGFCITGASRYELHPSVRPLLPVFIYDSTVMVPGNRRATTIYAIPRFTLPPGRRLLIVIRERVVRDPGKTSPVQGEQSGRDLRVQAGNGILQRARLI